ncbi:MAG: non-hydrolyzing UDP-N-acetylglucosamine 2-epimerase [Bacillota bacterium]
MKKIKIMPLFGTRPEAIKMAPVIKKLKQCSHFLVQVAVTGQHREMLDQVLDLFSIKPDYDLDIMESNQTLNQVSAAVLQKLKPVLEKNRPDLVLVQGDTTTAFMGALTAFYEKIKVGHIEAGLRTNRKYAPYPEEVNRRLTGDIADLHFAPTPLASRNLQLENISEDSIYVTGNTVIDALQEIITGNFKFENEKINQIDFENNFVLLFTCHRRENIGQLESIFQSVKKLLTQNEDLEVIFPVHMNPVIQKNARKFFSNVERIHLLEPLEYIPFVNLMACSDLVLTDSGGIQEEAPSLGKPVLVMRRVTERPEGLKAGTIKLIGTEKGKIVQEVQQLIDDRVEYEKMAQRINPYGDGRAAQRIKNIILTEFGYRDNFDDQFVPESPADNG